MVEDVRHEHREHILNLSDLGIPTNGALRLPPAAGHHRGPVSVLADEVVGGSSVPALVERQAVAQPEVESCLVHQVVHLLQLEVEQEGAPCFSPGPAVQRRAEVGQIPLVEDEAVVVDPDLVGHLLVGPPDDHRVVPKT
eukprot:8828479-Pyramimonas_sp.AAC.1